VRAIHCNAFEGIKALSLAEAAEPHLAADEVLVDVHAASVSFMETDRAAGQVKTADPYIPDVPNFMSAILGAHARNQAACRATKPASAVAFDRADEIAPFNADAPKYHNETLVP
jgi:hypothetical protein